jgi:phosphopantetheinyl transferase
MPLIYDHCNLKDTRVMVWETTEEDSFFLSELNLTEEEHLKYNSLRPFRKTEWLTSRYLCKLIDNHSHRRCIIKDTYGKPSIEGSDYHISLSHSKNRVALIKSPSLVGIDIQKQEDKISRIQHKFISPEEYDRLDVDNLDSSFHIFWGAKECMYKAYGKKEIKFKEHLHLYPFQIHNPQLEIKGWLNKNNIHQDYDIYTDKIDDYYLVYSILNNEV